MTDQSSRSEDAARAPQGKPPKRPYRTPTVVEYGSVAKLTRGTKSVSADGPGNTQKFKACL